MKKYIKLLPLIVFPYAYLILFLLINFVPVAFARNSGGVLILALTAVYLLLTVVSTICGSVSAAKSGITPYAAAKLNLTVKALQIPAYIFHFLLGLAGTIMSVWGIGLVIFAVLIDIMSIILTGIHAVGCIVKIGKENIILKGHAVIAGICSFIFCIDLITAVILLILTRKNQSK